MRMSVGNRLPLFVIIDNEYSHNFDIPFVINGFQCYR